MSLSIGVTFDEGSVPHILEREADPSLVGALISTQVGYHKSVYNILCLFSHLSNN